MARWYLLGAGNMGVLAGRYLQRSGHEVIAIHPRDGTLQRRVNLPGQTPDDVFRCPVIAPEAASGIRYLLVATKCHQTVAALTPLLDRFAAGATLVVLQNGMGSLDDLALPWHVRRVDAISFSGAWRDGDTHQVVAENTTLMGNGDTKPPVWFHELRAGWPHLRWERDIQLHQLMKLAVNAVINPLTAWHDCANGRLAEDAELARQAYDLAQEVDDILSAWRSDWPRGTPERSLGVALDTAGNTSSMRSDRLHGRPTEIDFINGWLLARAREHNISAPMNEWLVRALTINVA
jgi:2-dehydropantoate 2-reductase